MKRFKKSIILAILLLGSVALNAQTFHANYEYDANGNRTKATVIYLVQAPPSQSQGIDALTPATAEPIYVEDMIHIDPQTSLTIRVYPNPTQGDLRVDLSGLNPEQLSDPSNTIRVWDIQGKLLITLKPIEPSNRVDLSFCKNGIYIMQLSIGGKVKEYKLVKN